MRINFPIGRSNSRINFILLAHVVGLFNSGGMEKDKMRRMIGSREPKPPTNFAELDQFN